MNNKIFRFFLLAGVMLLSLGASAQSKVTGKVVDSHGVEIIGATVKEAGTKNATVTDFDGNYSITVGANATLRISYIGYKDVNVKVGSRSVVNVTMTDDETALEEVVVVGENKTMYQLCKFNDNHAKGSLISYNDKIICLSGNHNKKVEMFSETNNSLINLNEMNIERSNFSACIIDNKYIFALFGYNYPTHQCLDTIEFYELKNLENNINNNTNGCGWRYLNYKNNQFLNLSIEGHICFNYNDEKIIFFGGFNGKNNEAVDSFYQLILNGDNFNTNQAYKGVYVEKMDIKLNDIYKNGCYFFGNNNGFMFDKNLFASFDNNSNAHVLEINNMKHHIYYFE